MVFTSRCSLEVIRFRLVCSVHLSPVLPSAFALFVLHCPFVFSSSPSLPLADEGVQPKKSPSKWNETDLDVSYERKPHHTYDS